MSNIWNVLLLYHLCIHLYWFSYFAIMTDVPRGNKAWPTCWCPILPYLAPPLPKGNNIAFSISMACSINNIFPFTCRSFTQCGPSLALMTVTWYGARLKSAIISRFKKWFYWPQPRMASYTCIAHTSFYLKQHQGQNAASPELKTITNKTAAGQPQWWCQAMWMLIHLKSMPKCMPTKCMPTIKSEKQQRRRVRKQLNLHEHSNENAEITSKKQSWTKPRVVWIQQLRCKHEWLIRKLPTELVNRSNEN